MLMQLRKAANHHLLHRKLYDESKLRTMAKLMVKVSSITHGTRGESVVAVYWYPDNSAEIP